MNLHLVGEPFLMTQCSACLTEEMAEVKAKERSVEKEPWASGDTSMQGWESHRRILGCEV